MISLELDMELPSKCKECPFRSTLNGKWYCSVSQVNMSNECVHEKRPFWCKLKDNRELEGRLHFKTKLCDGKVHLYAKDYIEHSVKVNYEKQKMKLKKLAGNPILDIDIRHMLAMQIYNINTLEWWRERYIELQGKYEELQKRDKSKLIHYKYGKEVK